jgi:hypothetical protein
MKKFTTIPILGGLVLLMNLPFSPQAWGDDSTMSNESAFGAAISDSDLGTQRGGDVRVTNTNNLDAQLHDNSATANVTGSNFVTSSAFSGSSGFSTVVQNSGNNVIIQNATVLNLQLQ